MPCNLCLRERSGRVGARGVRKFVAHVRKFQNVPARSVCPSAGITGKVQRDTSRSPADELEGSSSLLLDPNVFRWGTGVRLICWGLRRGRLGFTGRAEETAMMAVGAAAATATEHAHHRKHGA